MLSDLPEYELLSVAIGAAIEAGDHFRERVDSSKQVKMKTSFADVVTEVDSQCEAIIYKHIRATYPHHVLLGEEQVAPGSSASIEAINAVSEEEHLWIIDPLDGTTNFVQHMRLSVVSIAYAHKGKVMLGVIYDPYHDEVFLAYKGRGAYRTSSREAQIWCDLQIADHKEKSVVVEHTNSFLPCETLQVSKRQEIEKAILATGFPARGGIGSERTDAGLKIVAAAGNLRAIGSAALHLAWIAAGRVDGYWEYDLNAWDIAAGILLVQEAGGQAGAIGSGIDGLRVRDVLATGTATLSHTLNTLLLI